MDGNIENGALNELKGKVVTIPTIDATLSKEGYSADAKVTGDAIRALSTNVASMTVSSSGTMGYDNKNSGLAAVNVQTAIDEVAKIAKDALPTNGTGMITGALKVRNADNGYGSVNKNNSATEDYGTQVVDHSKSGLSAFLNVSALRNLLQFTNSNGNTYNVLHEGNKKYGTYTGNGKTTETLVATGSVGRLLAVYNAQYFCFVTTIGALAFDLTEGTFRWIDSTKVFYINGTMKCYTNNAALNAANTTYNYQAI